MQTQALLPSANMTCSTGAPAFIELPHALSGLPCCNAVQAIAARYGVLLEKAGIALRGLFIINPDGIIQQITINDLVRTCLCISLFFMVYNMLLMLWCVESVCAGSALCCGWQQVLHQQSLNSERQR